MSLDSTDANKIIHPRKKVPEFESQKTTWSKPGWQKNIKEKAVCV